MSTVQEMPPDLRSRPVVQTDDFVYRPMPTLVPVCMAFVFLSLLAGLSDLLLIVPLTGAVLSFIAYYQISRSRGELSGTVISQACLLLTLLMFVGFGALHFASYITEVPDGYSRVNFTNDISKKGLEIKNGELGVHPDVAKLSDKPIYLKGYMFPFRETRGLKSFILCKDSGECCFGGQPKPTDMILINMVGDAAVDYHEKQLVGVAGTLRVEPKFDQSGLTPVYQLDCKHFAPAKTWY